MKQTEFQSLFDLTVMRLKQLMLDRTGLEAYIDKTIEEMQSIMLGKGLDYEGSADRLGSFKNVADMTTLKPQMVCLNLIALKVQRLSSLISNDKEPNNESINDNATDLLNYSFILKAIIQDLKQ